MYENYIDKRKPETQGQRFRSDFIPIKGYMKSDASLCELHFFTPHPQPEQLQEAADSDVLIFAFPLYVDGIPSHMVSALLDLETVIRKKKKKRTVYAILNCGFYEGCQNAVALR
mgnify:CR=1 FL=1